MANKSTIKRDCFGCKEIPVTVNGEKACECTALEEMDCAKGTCKFYKHKMQYLHELAMKHGTTNLDLIVRMYAEKRGEPIPTV